MHIDSYGFGKIVIDGKEYVDDVIITPAGVLPDWWRAKGHDVSLFDLAHALDPAPERLIIGTGASGLCSVKEEVRSFCASQGIELIEVPTPEAVVEYNGLDDASTTVAALHLTC
ncbi:MAG: hypothetical protein JXA24_01785 [Proteobacteria bacterium]|nr:hypothetical protein [Pseudomonadota bacterium]